MNSTLLHRMIRPLSRIRNRCLYATVIGLSVASPSFTQGKVEYQAAYDMLHAFSCAHERQERLFVFLNSGFYYPGENIAFKAVLFDADMKIKADGSRFFYLQLITGSGTAIGNYTYALYSGECSGTIKIPDTLITGLYTLKAYTRWMQNYNPANCFKRPVLVISPLGGSLLQTSLCDSLPLRFYPESGKFIEGIENTMLVRTDPCQHDSIRKLHITDELGKTILSFGINPCGATVFSFTPEPGRWYHAVTADSGKPAQTFDLPEPQHGGYNMHLETGRDSLHIRITVARETETPESLCLAVMTGNAGKSAILPVEPVNQSASISMPLAGLPAGISQLVLFGANTVLCSRVWYRKSGQVAVEGQNSPDTLETREFINASIPFNHAKGQDNMLVVSLNEYNMVTDSLLFNEINYFRYFDLYSSLSNPEILPVFDTSASETEINNCLMAPARCLPMDFAMQDRDELFHAIEDQGIVLSGKVFFPSTQNPVKGATVLLACPDSVAHMNYSITNEKGEFSFTLNDKLYNREMYIIAQGYPRDQDPVMITPDDPFTISSFAGAVSTFDHPGAAKVISDHQNIAMAFRVFYPLQSQASNPALRTYSTYREDFYGKPDFKLITADFEPLPDIFEIRKNLVPRLKLKVRDDYCLMTVFDEYLQLFLPYEAFVMLNNIPYPSFKNVLELNSDIIRSIELKSKNFFYDNYIMYGIVSIKTRKPVAVEPHYSYRITSVDVMPQTVRFHSVKGAYEETQPDVRHSLYWRTEQTSLAEMSGICFSTSDIKGNYQLKVYSVTRDGKLHVADKVFTVL